MMKKMDEEMKLQKEEFRCATERKLKEKAALLEMDFKEKAERCLKRLKTSGGRMRKQKEMTDEKMMNMMRHELMIRDNKQMKAIMSMARPSSDPSAVLLCLLLGGLSDELILIQKNLSWTEAVRYCRENHVDLVSVDSQEIQLMVTEVLHQASTAEVWLGLHYYCLMNLWIWVRGEVVCYQNWAVGVQI
ncbi:hypothetical protein E1301_Tti023216 [Triplophysa tibetana]|uniref:C-type lectin domain-containing protein n=1 Tax=Triplophysa tibetana TaxID=1572043 RepID=A0A5A9PI79_9TELE|nr:hypothetical protein E1301_Tti023216 [Triplophysa tibetana]